MKSSLAVVASALLAAACGSDPKEPLFQPQPECEGDPVDPFAGDAQNIISSLEIGSAEDGFDLDGDGMPDNKLTAVGSLAGSAIRDAIEQYDIMIPFEFFDLPSVANDECVKFALYLGAYKQDVDDDGEDTAVEDGDCDDSRASSQPDNPEIADNLLDDDCDGLADDVGETSPPTPSGNDVDNDGDTYSPADGDCDDTTETGAMSSPALAETCGDGFDNDCDGTADRGPEGPGSCNPYEYAQTIDIDPLSFESNGDPIIAFTNGTIENGVLRAGPSLFSVNIPTGLGDLELELTITGAQIEAQISADGDSVRLEGGRLGGVLSANTMDNVRGLTVEEINLTPENSLLDATFANILGTILALPNSERSEFAYCKTPDIDVDQDGLEAFCDSDPNDDNKVVDICVDGDGTVFNDGDEGETHCTQITKPDGTLRFPDGVSVELNFTSAPAILRAPE
jgi:hypothetical protein